MKRYYMIISIFFLGISFTKAQNEFDVLLFSRNFVVGTARSAGMGGAIGSLGGDFSSLSVNPAGLGIYRSSEVTFTPMFSTTNTTSRFLNNVTEEGWTNFGISNFGYVYANTRNQESGWISTNFAVGYNMLNNYNQQTYMGGINNDNSFLDDFGTLSDDPNSGEFLFYKDLALKDSLLIYLSDFDKYTNDFQLDGYGQFQDRLLTTTGSSGEFSFSFGANYNNFLYLGALFGVHNVYYDRSYIHTEDDPTNKIFYVDQFNFYENQRTRGYGFSGKLGAIIRPVDFLRIGAAFHIPTFYFLHDEFTTDMTAYYDDFNPLTASSPFGENSYDITTPFKFIGSVTSTIGKIAMVSMDYEYIDYSQAKYEGNAGGYSDVNGAVKQMFKPTSNIRFGGEMRLSSIYLRGGYAYYGSPYAMVDPKADESQNVYSGGIGFRSRSFFFDFGYMHRTYDQAYYMYKSQVANGALNTVNINNFTFTFGFKF